VQTRTLDHQPPEEIAPMSDKAKPAHKIRNRSLTVTIWKHDSDKAAWYTVRPSRSYKQGEEWKESDTYREDDLLPLAKLLDQAHSWIVTAQQAERRPTAEGEASRAA
jgi:hypothetical protein